MPRRPLTFVVFGDGFTVVGSIQPRRRHRCGAGVGARAAGRSGGRRSGGPGRSGCRRRAAAAAPARIRGGARSSATRGAGSAATTAGSAPRRFQGSRLGVGHRPPRQASGGRGQARRRVGRRLDRSGRARGRAEPPAAARRAGPAQAAAAACGPSLSTLRSSRPARCGSAPARSRRTAASPRTSSCRCLRAASSRSRSARSCRWASLDECGSAVIARRRRPGAPPPPWPPCSAMSAVRCASDSVRRTASSPSAQARWLVRLRLLGPGDRVVELGLQRGHTFGDALEELVDVVGVVPAELLAERHRAEGSRRNVHASDRTAASHAIPRRVTAIVPPKRCQRPSAVRSRRRSAKGRSRRAAGSRAGAGPSTGSVIVYRKL